MDTYRAIVSRRSIRRFKQKPVSAEVIKKCVNAGRLAPTGANRQPLKFMSITERLKEIFDCTRWAGYLDWSPSKDEMPRAYIAILKNEERGSKIDVGIAAENICLAAHNEGIGSCMLGSIDRGKLRKILPVPSDYDIELLIALGYPDQKAEIYDSADDIEYHMDDDVLKVPKKPLEDIWIKS
ncbi:MAG: nitroreductase [Thermoplasmata archaeon]